MAINKNNGEPIIITIKENIKSNKDLKRGQIFSFDCFSKKFTLTL